MPNSPHPPAPPPPRDATRDDRPASELPALFLRFLRFGCLAWGGPAAQIAMIHRELVEDERWIDDTRFARVLAVYQALPGPEALELCCYFGALRAGRIGGVLAGLAFMLPGFVLMLIASWAYTRWGLTSPIALAALAGAQPAAAALVARAVVRLGSAMLANRWLIAIALLSAFATALGAHFLYVLACAAASAGLAVKDRLPGAIGLIALGVGAVIVGVLTHFESIASLAPRYRELDAASRAATSAITLWPLLLIGLKAGMLSFGGAYAALPFLRKDAAEPPSGWMSHTQFLDGLAIGSILPAPLLIISTFVGYLCAGLPGALVATTGVFLPAFAFTLLGHRHLELVVDDERLHAWLDGLAAGTVGLIAATAFELLAQLPRTLPAWSILIAALALTLLWRSRWCVPTAMLAAAAAGILLHMH